MKYGIYYGCAIPSRLPFVEKSTAVVLGRLGVDAAPLADPVCCMDPIVLKSLSVDAWLTVAARNLAVAEDQGFDGLLTLCNGCFCSLNEASRSLGGDAILLGKVNESLAKVGRRYAGGVRVLHLTQLLDGVPAEDLAPLVVRPLEGRRFATFHGCHLVRPGAHSGVDDPVRPRILDRLVERLGAEAVPYSERNECCGMGFAPTGERTGAERLAPVLEAMEAAGAEGVVTPCPSCFLQIEGAQRLAKLSRPLPVLHVAELFALAFGTPEEEMGLRHHRVRFAGEGVAV